MEKENYEYIAKRCEAALSNNKEYINLERSNAASEEVQEVAEIISYQTGFRDAVRTIIKCL